LALSFQARIRLEKAFSGPEALARQIAEDVAKARQILATVKG
jgi:FAD synthase